jgi:hypothetical protein
MFTIPDYHGQDKKCDPQFITCYAINNGHRMNTTDKPEATFHQIKKQVNTIPVLQLTTSPAENYFPDKNQLYAFNHQQVLPFCFHPYYLFIFFVGLCA